MNLSGFGLSAGVLKVLSRFEAEVYAVTERNTDFFSLLSRFASLDISIEDRVLEDIKGIFLIEGTLLSSKRLPARDALCLFEHVNARMSSFGFANPLIFNAYKKYLTFISSMSPSRKKRFSGLGEYLSSIEADLGIRYSFHLYLLGLLGNLSIPDANALARFGSRYAAITELKNALSGDTETIKERVKFTGTDHLAEISEDINAYSKDAEIELDAIGNGDLKIFLLYELTAGTGEILTFLMKQ